MLTISIEEKTSYRRNLWTADSINKATIACELDDGEAAELSALFGDYLRAQKDCHRLMQINPEFSEKYKAHLKSTMSELDKKAKKILGNYAQQNTQNL